MTTSEVCSPKIASTVLMSGMQCSEEGKWHTQQGSHLPQLFFSVVHEHGRNQGFAVRRQKSFLIRSITILYPNELLDVQKLLQVVHVAKPAAQFPPISWDIRISYPEVVWKLQYNCSHRMWRIARTTGRQAGPCDLRCRQTRRHSRDVAQCTAEVSALRAAAGNVLLHVHKAGKVPPPPEPHMQLLIQLRIPGALHVRLKLE